MVIHYTPYQRTLLKHLSAGIGLEGHEQPYLRGGSRDIIQTGHTFSNEPGIYIEDTVRRFPLQKMMACKRGLRDYRLAYGWRIASI
jgi:hypothetical protein